MEHGGVGVVGAPGKQNAMASRLVRPGDRALVAARDGVGEPPLGHKSRAERLVELLATDRGLGGSEGGDAFKKRAAVLGRVGDPLGRGRLEQRRGERDGIAVERGGALAERVGVLAAHRAAVAAHVLRHENCRRPVGQQRKQPRVRKLRRVADAFRGDGVESRVAALRVGGEVMPGHDHREAEHRHERVPERGLIVRVQGVDDADVDAASLFGSVGRGEPREERLLEGDGVGRLGAFVQAGKPEARRHALGARPQVDKRFRPVAAVAVDVGEPGAERYDRQLAGVLATRAASPAALRAERLQGLRAEDPAFRAAGLAAGAAGAVARDEGAADRPHEPRRFRADDLAAEQLLERAQHGVGHERPALGDDRVPKAVEAVHTDDAEECVADDRIGGAGGEVAHGRPRLLRMAHARGHEHGALRAEVDRRLGGKRLLGKAGGRRPQRSGRPLDKRPAAARTCLVEHGLLDHAVAHPDGLDVLAADVEQEREVGHVFERGGHVGGRLHDARVDPEGGAQEVLPVARRRGVGDEGERLSRIRARKVDVELLEHVDRRRERVALGRAVVGVRKAPLFVDDGDLHGSRSGIDAEVEVAAGVVAADALRPDVGVALAERGDVVGVAEERLEAGEVVFRVGRLLDGPFEPAQRHRARFFPLRRNDGRAEGGE